jgi:hypothetical protein
MGRSREKDQKQRGPNFLYAVRANLTATMIRACSRERLRRLFLPPRRPISAKYARVAFEIII